MNQNKWCVAWDPVPTFVRTALPQTNKWPGGMTLALGFMDGPTALHRRVFEAACGWIREDGARLRFRVVPNPRDAYIRISFQHRGSWSVLGTAAWKVPRDQPTMNFGWLNQSSADVAVRSVVLHEFGHALGLIHEHQNPSVSIPWRRDAIYEQLAGPPNYWTRTQIETNVLKPYDKEHTNYKAFDSRSIMLYPIPEGWVTDPAFVTDLNTDLSDTDREYIRHRYC